MLNKAFKKKGALAFAEPEITAFDDEQYVEALNGCRETIDALYRNRESVFHANATPLDETLKQVGDALELEVGHRPKSWSDLVGGFKGASAQFRCCDCSKSQNVCNGSYGDDLLVAEGGRCVPFVRDAFQLASKVAADRYSLVADSRLPVVELHSMPIEDPGSTPSTLCTAFTRLTDRAGEMQATVQLSVPISQVTPSVPSSAYYVLFHELICHVYQSCLQGAGRKNSSNSDQFREGWMDLVAFDLTIKTMRDVSVAREYDISPIDAQHIQEVAQQLHQSRYIDAQNPKRLQHVHREFGRSTGYIVKAVIRSICEMDGGNPDDEFINLSIRLNAAVSEADGRRLASSFRCRLPAWEICQEGLRLPDWLMQAPADRRMGVDTLRKYLRSKDLQSLLLWALT